VKRELDAGTGTIRVMTVHGAKGLEAPVVILPDSTGAVNEKPDDNLIFDEHGPYFSQREKDDDAAGSASRAAYKEQMRAEHWRLLYVAMTRARDRLIVCGAQHGSSEEGEDKNSWRAAVEAAMREMKSVETCETPFGEGWRFGKPLFAAKAAAAVKESAALPAWARTPVAGAAPAQLATPSRAAHIDPALFSPRADGQKRFRRGKLIHGLLERLPDVAGERRESAAKAWLKRQAATDDEIEAYAREAMSILNDPRFAMLFGPMSRAEAPIVGMAGTRPVRGVVDRLAVDDERVMVLDYKTDRPAPTKSADAPLAYVTQLALYREVLRAVFPGKRVDCALLWTERPLLMELAPTQLDAAFAQFRGG
jgi:ATP-dependent helicase/nuclease subunit A